MTQQKFLVLIGDADSPTPTAPDAPAYAAAEYRGADTVLVVRSDYSSAYVMKYAYGAPGECEVFVCDMRGVAQGDLTGPSVRALREENAELRHHSSRLVALLRGAWWVEAAEHLHELSRLTRDPSDRAA